MNRLNEFSLSEVAREIMAMMAIDLVPCLWSSPGVGKTSVAKQVASQLCWKCIVAHPAAMPDSSDLSGIPVPSKEGDRVNFLPYGILERILAATQETLVLIDDVGQSAMQLQAPIMQLIENRSINSQVVPDCIHFLLASNDVIDRAGCNRMISPLEGRCVHMFVRTDLSDWTAWALNAGVAPEVIAFHQFSGGEHLHKFDPKSSEKAFPSPRSWEKASRIFSVCSHETRIRVMAGAVGQGAATAFSGFLRVYETMPDLSDCIANPDTAPLPESGAGVEYAISYGLFARMNIGNSANVCKYVARLSFPEYFIAAIQAADSAVLESKAPDMGKRLVCRWPGVHSFLTANKAVYC